MSGFSKSEHVIDGVRVQVLEAGSGDPIIYFHGAGAGRGFDELLPLAKGRRLIVPIHPGFGASEDDPRIDSMFDYAMHYAALFDALGLNEPVDVIGHSLGGWMASFFTALNTRRVRKLVLVCPAGMRVPEHPTADLFKIPAETLNEHLVFAPAARHKLSQVTETVDMKVARYREMTSLARIGWDRMYDPKLPRWLGRIFSPTLILWGERDRVIPPGQAAAWADVTPDSTVQMFADAGHLLFFEEPKALAAAAAFL